MSSLRNAEGRHCRLFGISASRPKSTQAYPRIPKSTQVYTSQPKSTQVHPSRPKSTQVDPSQPESTQVDPSQPKSTQVNPSRPKSTQDTLGDPSDQSNPSRTGHTEPACIEANYIICLSNHTAKESPRKSHYIYIPKER